MRTLSGIAATVLLLFSASAENSFLDDAPKGFIHIQEATQAAIADTFIRITKVVSIEVVTQDKEKGESTVLVRTSGLKGSEGLAYYIRFDNRADALKCANRTPITVDQVVADQNTDRQQRGLNELSNLESEFGATSRQRVTGFKRWSEE